MDFFHIYFPIKSIKEICSKYFQVISNTTGCCSGAADTGFRHFAEVPVAAANVCRPSKRVSRLRNCDREDMNKTEK